MRHFRVAWLRLPPVVLRSGLQGARSTCRGPPSAEPEACRGIPVPELDEAEQEPASPPRGNLTDAAHVQKHRLRLRRLMGRRPSFMHAGNNDLAEHLGGARVIDQETPQLVLGEGATSAMACIVSVIRRQ